MKAVLYHQVFFFSFPTSPRFTPHKLGCDFNSPIWNITGVPSSSDDVIISSNVQITIFANNSNILLHSLIFGTGSSLGVLFILYNSILNITSSGVFLPFLNLFFFPLSFPVLLKPPSSYHLPLLLLSLYH